MALPLESYPVIGFVGWSGSGKTTLLKEIVRRLREQGRKVAVIKHAHHSFDVDHPGKDSYELRHAGARKVLVASRLRWALMVETPEGEEPDLGKLLTIVGQDPPDLILVEGFKRFPYPKVEVYRPSLGLPPLYSKDPHVVAVASPSPERELPAGVTWLNLNEPQEVLAFIERRLKDRVVPS
ncbi:molybdopterin-guanine dinucleotide biosynthesis protein B [Candidatus Methylacidithermus pantelleriae]|uniref:Molybdopterin-guanine dinucleotide biosynthesis adaptor protein n=1 Tax=Candidatus Methylacidithermus pantelleriae TaxID=2744239 RepID=A0A8J2BLL7_9BACT|nr:molybdopterin-guanine dinucleotide biosynthesis adaptor protein [Candidatus Methylacidithermus pantelleriae]